ncbi:MAG TPA: TIGR03118 family protein [Pirellulales bacterium]
MSFTRRSTARRPGQRKRSNTRTPRSIARSRIERLEDRRLLTSEYLQYALVSDQAGHALIQDTNLVNPWGIGLSPFGGDFAISDNGTGVSTLYGGDVAGSPLARSSLVVGIPGGAPTGQIANTTNGFTVSAGGTSASADFLIAGGSGNISGYSASVPPPSPSNSAQLGATVAGANFTGLALGQDNQQGVVLYAADFHNGTVDVFNSSFQRVTLSGSFTDPNLPAGFAPFNIENIAGRLYVTYAAQDATRQHDLPGPGNGFVDVFDMSGNLMSRLIVGQPGVSTSPLNSPWGVALAPNNFGGLSGDLLVANAGDGHINAFEPVSGAFLGALLDPSGNPMTIDGLRGIAFGNGASAGNTGVLFFTAGPNSHQHGLFGSIVSIDGDPLDSVGAEFSASPGTPFNSVVATFSDTTTSGAFPVTIDWGDGGSSAGVVTSIGGNRFLVSGSHTYASTGSFNVTVSIVDSQSNSTVATSTAVVGQASGGTLSASGTAIAAQEGAVFNGAVATFTDGDGNTSAAAYTATIVWGDGFTTTGAVSAVSGGFQVTGQHTYSDEGAAPVSVRIVDSDGATATATSTATIAEADAFTGQLTLSGVTEGAAKTFTVATIDDANHAALPTDFSATIDWGDGTITSGTVGGAAGAFSVSGTHGYADEGAFTVRVTLADDSPGTAAITLTGQINVAEGDALTPVAASPSPTEGNAFSGLVATFLNANSAAQAGDFSAAIDWGDGTTTAGALSGSAGTLSVRGSHTYADEGTYAMRVTLSDDAPGAATATANGAIHVADADLSATGVAVRSTEGVTFAGAVATFTDANPAATAGDFAANIGWGDGTTTTGTVAANGSGGFSVSGQHAYAEGGVYLLNISIADTGGSQASAVDQAVVADYPITGSPVSVSGTEGAAFAGAVAMFNDTDPDGGNPSEYVVSIDWGDGAIAAGSVTGAAGHYTVSGAHTFADEASGVTVTVNDAGGATATIRSPAVIADSDVLTGAGLTLTATEGQTLSSALATFTDANTTNSADDFAATINWGDGTTDSGVVSGGAGNFTISGSHNYADEGTRTATVVLSDDSPGTAKATATAPVKIADAPLSSSPLTFHPTEAATFNGVVAMFTDANAAAPISDFTAVIDWGDGTVGMGSVVAAGGGAFHVIGSHLFGEEGTTAQVSVTIQDVGGSSVTATSTAVVDDAPLNVAAMSLSGMEQSASAWTVATFTDAGPIDALGDYSAVIDWGDGTSSAGTITLSGGVFTISGSHSYSDEGRFNLSVTASEAGGGSGAGQATATILEQLLADGTRGTPDERWVNEVFHDLLDRQADPGALSFFAHLAAGGNRQPIVATIQNSDEYRADQVNALYEHYLHRAADPSGQAFFVSFLESGHTVEQIAAILAASPEYFASRGGNSNDGFLDALFHDALGRAVDAGARQFFDQALASGETRSQVAATIFASEEYLSDVVRGIYAQLLERSVDAGGLAFWVAQLRHGAHDDQIVSGVAASSEYFAKTLP